MARLTRLCPVNIPQHIIQRGNNRQVCFNADADFAAYAEWLREFSEKYYVDIHSWVFMTNHVHLLATPREENAVSRMMQSLGRCYVRYYNKMYKRTGTLWEGRFKSCLVGSGRYLLQCYKYIETNPVRAGMVDGPLDYHWSSYRSNALGLDTQLLTPHEEYLSLGHTASVRLEAYRALFDSPLKGEVIAGIRDSTNRSMAFGSDKFKDEIESNLKRRLRPAKVGRKGKLGDV